MSVSQEEIAYLYQHNLARHLSDVAEEFERRLMNKSVERGHKGLKMSFAIVLSRVGFAGSRLVDIAEQHGMTKQAVSQIANEIEELGYIRRVPDPADGRAKNIVFTGKGRRLIRDSTDAVHDVEREFAELIGEEKLQTLSDITAELVEKLGLRPPK